MRILTIILVLFTNLVFAQDALLKDVRQNIGEVFQEEEVCDRIYAEFEKTDVSSNNLLVGYKGGVLMGVARHHINPLKKMSYFNDGKELLEKAISVTPKSIELRFLRLTIQTNLPSFLGYSDEKMTDKAFVLSNLVNVESDLLKKRMSNFISSAEEAGKL